MLFLYVESLSGICIVLNNLHIWFKKVVQNYVYVFDKSWKSISLHLISLPSLLLHVLSKYIDGCFYMYWGIWVWLFQEHIVTFFRELSLEKKFSFCNSPSAHPICASSFSIFLTIPIILFFMSFRFLYWIFLFVLYGSSIISNAELGIDNGFLYTVLLLFLFTPGRSFFLMISNDEITKRGKLMREYPRNNPM